MTTRLSETYIGSGCHALHENSQEKTRWRVEITSGIEKLETNIVQNKGTKPKDQMHPIISGSAFLKKLTTNSLLWL